MKKTTIQILEIIVAALFVVIAIGLHFNVVAPNLLLPFEKELFNTVPQNIARLSYIPAALMLVAETAAIVNHNLSKRKRLT